MKELNFLLLVFCLACLSPLPAQEFSDIDKDMDILENLILDTLRNTEAQQKLLEDLKLNLIMSGELIDNYESIISGQEVSLQDLREQLNRMSETYRKQSALSVKYEKNLKFWRTFTLIAVPAAALISGGIVWAVK